MTNYKCKQCFDTGFIPVFESILPILTGRPCPYCDKGKSIAEEQNKNIP